MRRCENSNHLWGGGGASRLGGPYAPSYPGSHGCPRPPQLHRAPQSISTRQGMPGKECTAARQGMLGGADKPRRASSLEGAGSQPALNLPRIPGRAQSMCLFELMFVLISAQSDSASLFAERAAAENGKPAVLILDRVALVETQRRFRDLDHNHPTTLIAHFKNRKFSRIVDKIDFPDQFVVFHFRQ